MIIFPGERRNRWFERCPPLLHVNTDGGHIIPTDQRRGAHRGCGRHLRRAGRLRKNQSGRLGRANLHVVRLPRTPRSRQDQAGACGTPGEGWL